MAVILPIITEFDGAGISKAVRQFKQLETTSQKAQFAIKKAAIPAAAALAGLATAAYASVKAAIEDEKAQALLARQLVASTGATEQVVKSVEKYIEGLGKSVAVTDTEARPALARLVTATNDVAKAQELMAIAIDTAAATSKPLADVTDALSLAFAGNIKGLKALSPELGALIKDGGTAADAFEVLQKNFGGAGELAANTTSGQFKKLKIAIDETQESIGAALLPAVEAVLPSLQKFGEFAQNNPETFKNIAVAIGAVAASVTLLNFVIGLNPFVRAAAGIALLGEAVNEAAKQSEKIGGIGELFAKAAGSIALPGFAAQLVGNLFKDSADKTETAAQKLIKSMIDATTATNTFIESQKKTSTFERQLIFLHQEAVIATREKAEAEAKAAKRKAEADRANAEALRLATEAEKKHAEEIAKKKQSIDDYLISYKNYADSISGTITGLVSLSDAIDKVQSGESNNVGAAFEKQIQDAKAFGNNLKTLIGMGLGQAGLAQLLNLGPTAGIVVTDSMILGGRSTGNPGGFGVNELNSALQGLSDVGGGLGGAAAGAFMGAGTNVNITVNAGVGDPVAIGKGVVDALNAYKARTGSFGFVAG
jgi:hypothetical protein